MYKSEREDNDKGCISYSLIAFCNISVNAEGYQVAKTGSISGFWVTSVGFITAFTHCSSSS